MAHFNFKPGCSSELTGVELSEAELLQIKVCNVTSDASLLYFPGTRLVDKFLFILSSLYNIYGTNLSVLLYR